LGSGKIREIPEPALAPVCYIGRMSRHETAPVEPDLTTTANEVAATANEIAATANEVAATARALGARFIQRRDLYARQLDGGRYVAVYEPLQTGHLIAHLRGDMTLGVYALDGDSCGRHIVFDADDEPDWRRLKALAGVLSGMGCPAYLEHSRRGGHLWLFFAALIPGRQLRQFGNGLLHHFGIAGVELFPKQDRLKTGPGSLVRLPFGVHRKSGRRYGFYTGDDRPLAPTLRAQIMALEAAETVPEAVLERFVDIGAGLRRKPRFEATGELTVPVLRPPGELPLSERVKATIPVRSFVLQYVELSPAGRGLCPFHDDQVASFSVNDSENFWHCFACNRGGSIIDFWMEWRECEFKAALKELAGMLLDEPATTPAPLPVVDGQPVAV
jgi:hypothetical protein